MAYTKDEPTTTQGGKWVNILVEKDLLEKLDEMVAEDGTDRSKFIRHLISNEHGTRQQVKNFLAKMGKQKVSPRRDFIERVVKQIQKSGAAE